jgi:hypothetical protein
MSHGKKSDLVTLRPEEFGRIKIQTLRTSVLTMIFVDEEDAHILTFWLNNGIIQ